MGGGGVNNMEIKVGGGGYHRGPMNGQLQTGGVGFVPFNSVTLILARCPFVQGI